jgi:hypothetical protein
MRLLTVLSVTLLIACSNPTEAPPDPGSGSTLTHTFDGFTVMPGEEISDKCQSWTLGNEEPLYVSRVSESNGGAFHHSNWFAVPPSAFRGEDGTWTCRDRGYDEAVAGLVGGVFFAQSTQALAEVQEFSPGAAVLLPRNSVIVGGLHLLNATPSPIDTAIEFEVETIPEEEVDTVLAAMSFTNNHLDIAPREETRHRMECDLAETYQREFGRDPDFKIYYVLPHYHELGNYFRLELVGGERDGEVIYEVSSAVGDWLGTSFDPPLDVSGATGVRMVCGYDNPRDESVGYGIGDQEMCVFLAYTDSPLRFGAQSMDALDAGDAEGMPTRDSVCQIFSSRRF